MVVELMQIYKCSGCGSIVEVLHAGTEPVCCGKEMSLLEAKSGEEGKEKHKPVIEKTATGFKVKMGSIPHPMITEHYIEWVELITEDRVYRKRFVPGVAPETEFSFTSLPNKVWARCYCNIHGLWKSE